MKFFVRIEIHRTGEPGYAALHQKMAQLGYDRWIDGDAGRSPLPTAMYVREAGAYDTATSERDRVTTVARTIESNPWVLVLRTAAGDWAGHLQTNKAAA